VSLPHVVSGQRIAGVIGQAELCVAAGSSQFIHGENEDRVHLAVAEAQASKSKGRGKRSSATTGVTSISQFLFGSPLMAPHTSTSALAKPNSSGLPQASGDGRALVRLIQNAAGKTHLKKVSLTTAWWMQLLPRQNATADPLRAFCKAGTLKWQAFALDLSTAGHHFNESDYPKVLTIDIN